MNESLNRENDQEVDVFSAVRAPGQAGSVLPVKLGPGDRFAFSCHQGVACWNHCCHGADVTLTPYDILRLCRRLDLRPNAFLKAYTVPAMWEPAGLPVAKLKMAGDDGAGACAFLDEAGCSVYDARPATCRYYPLGLARIKPKGATDKENFHFLVKEPFCEGHHEDKVQSVSAFREEQVVGTYDRINRGWMDILMKMASWRSLGGPQGKELSAQVKQMFFLVSTYVDGLREFFFGTKFFATYDVDAAAVESAREDDEALLELGFDWMKNVMFNEPTIALKEGILREAAARARGDMGGL
jgi:Fe-S-cluster containining protein